MPARSPDDADAPTPSSSDIPVIVCITRGHRSPVGKKKAFGLERRFWSPSQDRVQFSLLRQHLIEILAEKKRVRGSLEKAAT
jgi:hypothetical protein